MPGNIIPEYTPADVQAFLDRVLGGLQVGMTLTVLVVAFIGFICAGKGIMVIRASGNRADSMQGQGDDSDATRGWTYICVGALLGIADLLYVVLVGLAKPS